MKNELYLKKQKEIIVILNKLTTVIHDNNCKEFINRYNELKSEINDGI